MISDHANYDHADYDDSGRDHADYNHSGSDHADHDVVVAITLIIKTNLYLSIIINIIKMSLRKYKRVIAE